MLQSGPEKHSENNSFVARFAAALFAAVRLATWQAVMQKPAAT
jgi:hypothetical protein